MLLAFAGGGGGGSHFSSRCCSSKKKKLRSPNRHQNIIVLRQLQQQDTDHLRIQRIRFPVAGFSHQSSKVLNSSVGSPTQWTLTHRHILTLDVIASVVAISTAWLFMYAIPAILTFKKAAESLEKLLDGTREKLPTTMTALRSSGMEISDLTMELSFLGLAKLPFLLSQEMTQKVKSSTQVVHVAEEKLRQFAGLPLPDTWPQIVMSKTDDWPQVAKSARSLKEGIVKSRSVLQLFASITHYYRLFSNLFGAKDQEKTR